MDRPDTRQKLILVAEVATTAIIGLALLVLKEKQLGEITWIIGFFQILARYTLARSVKDDLKELREHVDTELETVRGLSKVVDTSRAARTDKLREICDLYFQVTETEFTHVKDQVLEQTRIKLERLAHQRRSGTLVTGEYYNWLLPILRATESGSEIWAVSMMLDCEWDDSPEEREFLALNLNAVERGVRLTRVFVIHENDFDRVRALEPVDRQAKAGQFGNIRYVYRERLQRLDPQLLRNLGDGLIALDDRVALIDEHSQDGTARGYVTMNSAEIGLWRNDFENLLAYSDKLEPLPKMIVPGNTT